MMLELVFVVCMFIFAFDIVCVWCVPLYVSVCCVFSGFWFVSPPAVCFCMCVCVCVLFCLVCFLVYYVLCVLGAGLFTHLFCVVFMLLCWCVL